MPELPERQRIALEITEAIRRGELAPGQWLPRNPVLAARYEVSVSTVQRALDLLEERGVVTRHQGKGARVKGVPNRGAP